MPKETQITSEALADRVHSLMQGYVSRKAEARCGKTYEKFKESGYKDHDYIEANNKICMDAFLALRARKDHADFVSYFTGTICSVPQFLPHEEYTRFAAVLLDAEQWENVKSLSMLALSALSKTISDKKGDAQ